MTQRAWAVGVAGCLLVACSGESPAGGGSVDGGADIATAPDDIARDDVGPRADAEQADATDVPGADVPGDIGPGDVGPGDAVAVDVVPMDVPVDDVIPGADVVPDDVTPDVGVADDVSNVDAPNADAPHEDAADAGPADVPFVCTSHASCAGRGEGAFCDPASGRCVECALDDHCPAGRLCVRDACVAGCNAGHACPSGQSCCEGACVDPLVDVSHCGGCGRVCAPAGAVAACRAGVCAVASCTSTLADCNASAADGCETDTFTAAAHCGRCGAACALANATAACVAGACAVASCATGFANCDADAANGCEADTRTSSLHCGGCGTACGAGSACRAGGCVAVGEGASCLAILRARPAATTGTYRVDPDGDGPLPVTAVYCDMGRDGGGWTLVEVGRALGTNLYTRAAVGAVTDPMQTTSAKLSRAFIGALLRAGERRMRLGDPAQYGELYLGPISDAEIDTGLGAPGFGTVVAPNRVAASPGGTTYSGSRLAWPLDGVPAACLNSDGSTSECGAGLHLGTWPHIHPMIGDNVYVNYSATCCNLAARNTYRLWVR